ncbi:MAG: HAD hydrolase-like protein [Usitatibacteraceae bacterium]
MKKITHVLLDLDGTLTDPALGITNCIAYALSRLDAAVPSSRDLHFAIGPPLRGSFAQLLGTDEPRVIEQAMALYRERFADIGLFENKLYAGVPEMLAALRKQGHTLFLATAKPHVYAQRILAHFSIDTPFAGVYGSELDGTRQHKGDLLAHLFGIEKIDPASTVMVGDRHHDIDAARANACHAIGVTYGYGGAAELAHADDLCDSPAELLASVEALQAR